MDTWEILEIAPTQDKKQIKKAYAKKLKETQADDNPEEFQALKNALDQALLWAEDGQDLDLDMVTDAFQEFVQPVLQIEKELADIPFPVETRKPDAYKQLLNRLQGFQADFSQILDLEIWQDITAEVQQADLENYEKCQRLICRFLLEHYAVMKQEVVAFLFDQFDLFLITGRSGDRLFELFEKLKQVIADVPSFQFPAYPNKTTSERFEIYRERYEFYTFVFLSHQEDIDSIKWTNKLAEWQIEDKDFEALIIAERILYQKKISTSAVQKMLDAFVGEGNAYNHIAALLFLLNQTRKILPAFHFDDDFEQQLLDGLDTFLPDSLCFIYTGFIFYKKSKYDQAIACYEKVDNYYKEMKRYYYEKSKQRKQEEEQKAAQKAEREKQKAIQKAEREEQKAIQKAEREEQRRLEKEKQQVEQQAQKEQRMRVTEQKRTEKELKDAQIQNEKQKKRSVKEQKRSSRTNRTPAQKKRTKIILMCIMLVGLFGTMGYKMQHYLENKQQSEITSPKVSKKEQNEMRNEAEQSWQLDLAPTQLAQLFVTKFVQEPDSRSAFVDQYVASESKEQFADYPTKEQETLDLDKVTYTEEKDYQGGGKVLVDYDGTPLYIVEINSDSQISNVYGEGFSQIDEAQFIEQANEIRKTN